MSERFWRKVRKTAGCWEWTAARDDHDYGRFWLGGKMALAHRVAWEMEYGPIADGSLVLHSCDNPCCVRPDHLFLGTQADNVADCMAKGRRAPPHPRAKLTREQAMAIRRSSLPTGTLAERYGVTERQVRHIKVGKSWT